MNVGNFRKSLLAAGRKAWKDGKITRYELRNLRRFVFFARYDQLVDLRNRMAGYFACEEIIPSGVEFDWDDIDWEALVEQIVQIIKLILSIIAIF